MSIVTIILHLVLLCSFFCVGVYMVSRDKGDILFFLNEGTKNWPDYLRKPLVGCINCMASFYGTIVQIWYYVIIDYSPPLITALIIWVLVTVITAGLNGIIWLAYRYLELFVKANKEYDDKV
jgi:hypothetical protein